MCDPIHRGGVSGAERGPVPAGLRREPDRTLFEAKQAADAVRARKMPRHRSFAFERRRRALLMAAAFAIAANPAP